MVTTTPVTGELPSTSTTVEGLPAEPAATIGVATVSATRVDTSEPAGLAIPAMIGVAFAGAFGAPLLRVVSSRRGSA